MHAAIPETPSRASARRSPRSRWSAGPLRRLRRICRPRAAPPRARCPSRPTTTPSPSSAGSVTAARRPRSPVEGVTVTVEDDAGDVVGEATSGADGTFVDRPARHPDRAPRQVLHRRPRRVDAPRGHRARGPQRTMTINLDNDQSVTFPIGAAGPGGTGSRPGTPADRGRHRLLGAAGDGCARAVDDLRHDGADQLRPRRADHLRRPRRVRRRPAARRDRRSAAPTSPSSSR